MKIRSGFVSNSSSSSFLIACRASNKCPHCCCTPPNLLDRILQTSDGETEISYRGVEDVVRSLQKEIKEIEFELADFRNKDLKDMAYSWGRTTVKEAIESCQEEIKAIDEKIKKVQSFGEEFEIADVSISYHDDFLNNLFRELMQKGDVIRIAGEKI